MRSSSNITPAVFLALLFAMTISWVWAGEGEASEGAKKRVQEPHPPQSMKWGMTEKEWLKTIGKKRGQPNPFLISKARGSEEIKGVRVETVYLPNHLLGRRYCDLTGIFFEQGLQRVEYVFGSPNKEHAEEIRRELLNALKTKYGPPGVGTEERSETWRGKNTTIDLLEPYPASDGTMRIEIVLLTYESSQFPLLIEKAAEQLEKADEGAMREHLEQLQEEL